MKKKGPPTWVKQIQALYPEFPEYTDVNKTMYTSAHLYCTTPLGFVLSALSFRSNTRLRHAALWVLMDAGADPNSICDTQWPFDGDCEELLFKPLEVTNNDDDAHILIHYGAIISENMECDYSVHLIYRSLRRATATRWCCNVLRETWPDIAWVLVNMLMSK